MMIVYAENPKEYTNKLLEKSELIKVTGYKVNIKKISCISMY